MRHQAAAQYRTSINDHKDTLWTAPVGAAIVPQPTHKRSMFGTEQPTNAVQAVNEAVERKIEHPPHIVFRKTSTLERLNRMRSKSSSKRDFARFRAIL
jgi:hypothetical protein